VKVTPACLLFDSLRFRLCASRQHAHLQPWQNRDPPAEDSKACRGKPPSAVFRALIAAWREAHAAVSAALAAAPLE